MQTQHLPDAMIQACGQGVPVYLERALPADDYVFTPGCPSYGVFCGRRALERLQIEVDRARLIDQFRD